MHSHRYVVKMLRQKRTHSHPPEMENYPHNMAPPKKCCPTCTEWLALNNKLEATAMATTIAASDLAVNSSPRAIESQQESAHSLVERDVKSGLRRKSSLPRYRKRTSSSALTYDGRKLREITEDNGVESFFLNGKKVSREEFYSS